jgi:Flp pilus assembly protein TadG
MGLAMIKRAFNRLWNDERGNILIIAAAAMPMLIGAAGLATDTIQWTLWKRQLQRAADSAAIAGVYERNIAPLGATTGVPAAVLHDLSLNQHAGTLKESPTLEYPADVTTPDTRTNQVSVTLRIQKPLTFSSFFLKTPPVITARSTAASVPGSGEYCVIALDDRNVTGADIGGSTNIDLGECCLISNSTHPNQAFKNTGSGSTVKAGCIAAAGGVEQSDSANWDVDGYYPYSEPAADPFADIAVPKEEDCDETITFGAKVDAPTDRSVVDAGVAGKIVCITGGFEIKDDLTLGAATYVINTSGNSDDLKMHATGASLNCARCTIILTNFSDPTKTGNVRLTGGTVNISAPVGASDPYSGIALYQDRLAADDDKRGTNHVNGNSSSGVQGVIYMPGRSLLYNGGGGAAETGKCMQIVAKRVDFTGNSKFKMGSACASAGLKGHTGGGWLVRLVA